MSRTEFGDLLYYTFRALPLCEHRDDVFGLDQSDVLLKAEILPLVVEHLTQSRSEEEQGTWRAPIDLVELIRAAEDALRKNPPRTWAGAVYKPDFCSQVLGERPQAIIRAVAEALNQGVPPVDLARHLTLAAAWRLARFPESNDIEDWFAPMHTFSFCNALHRCDALVGKTMHAVG